MRCTDPRETTATITAATGQDTLTRGEQVRPAGTREPVEGAGVIPGSQWAPPAAGTGAPGVPVPGAAAALGTGAMAMTTWAMECHQDHGGTRVLLEVRGVAVVMVMDGVVGIREDLQVGTTGDGITEVLLEVL